MISSLISGRELEEGKSEKSGILIDSPDQIDLSLSSCATSYSIRIERFRAVCVESQEEEEPQNVGSE